MQLILIHAYHTSSTLVLLASRAAHVELILSCVVKQILAKGVSFCDCKASLAYNGIRHAAIHSLASLSSFVPQQVERSTDMTSDAGPKDMSDSEVEILEGDSEYEILSSDEGQSTLYISDGDDPSPARDEPTASSQPSLYTIITPSELAKQQVWQASCILPLWLSRASSCFAALLSQNLIRTTKIMKEQQTH